METVLAKNMVAKADADNLPVDHELRVLAEKFDKATLGFYGTPQTIDVKRYLGYWARARKVWCKYTGEPLI